MGLIITPQSEIDKYFESDALNQSTLKKLLKGFDYFISEQEKKDTGMKPYFIIGSAVDTILTGEEEEFENKFYVSKLDKKPSEIEMKIVDMVFDSIFLTGDYTKLSDYPDQIQTAVEHFGWQSRWKIETRVNKIIENGSDYFEDMKLAVGKTIVSKEQYELIESIVTSLRTSARTSKYFDRNQLIRTSEVDVYYQLPIYFEYKGVSCKSLLDILIVLKDEKNKPISIHPIDLKTMSGNTLDFLSNVKKHRYDIQGSWYTEALLNEKSSFNKNNEFKISKDIIKPFTFIVESSTTPGRPLLFNMSDDLLKIGKYGRAEVGITNVDNLFTYSNDEDPVVLKKIKGFDTLIDEYNYYEENGWEEDKLVKEKDGVLELNWDSIN